MGTYGIQIADFRHESGVEDLRSLGRYAPVKIGLLGFAGSPEGRKAFDGERAC